MYPNWKVGGVLLGLVFFAAVALVKPIGVSTQFVILDAVIADAVSPDFITQTDGGNYTSTNAYIAKSNGKYAEAAANPLNYGFVFVLAMVLGGFLGTLVTGRNSVEHRRVPDMWSVNFGGSVRGRYVWSFAAGILVIYGARLAGGCTSGHMMSGMMQTAVSGYVFAAGAFTAAIVTSLILYRKEA